MVMGEKVGWLCIFMCECISVCETLRVVIQAGIAVT